jgi:ribosomal subunit interface protein
MQTPLQLTFRGIDHSDAIATHVEERVGKLEHIFDRIVSCHVAVEHAGHHRGSGDRYRLTINIGLPGHELLVNHPPSNEHAFENAFAIADRAFDEAERQLEVWVKRQRAHRHEESR